MASTAAEPEHLSYDDARARVLDNAPELPVERIPLAQARGRIHRETVRAPHALPPFSNSSMDGYAMRAADTATASATRGVDLPVVEVIAAGQIASRSLGDGEAMRIMTGACIPEGADAVQQLEIVERMGDGADERVRISRPASVGDNIRNAGEDVSEGQVVIEPGHELTPHDLALLASLGIPEVTVSRLPRVTVLSTGDELLDIDEPLRPGAIRDSNLLMLCSLVESAGGVIVHRERLRDDVDIVRDAMRSAIEASDAVLTIGGVSAGDFDPVKVALEDIGGIALWRVAMKPGRPQAFGTPSGTLFYGLPGNPASVASVFEVMVRPALLRMQGSGTMGRPRIGVRAAASMGSRPGRRDFIRVTLARRDGEWWANPAGAQTSGHLLPQARAHALAVIPEDHAQMKEGETMQALVLRWPESMHGGDA